MFRAGLGIIISPPLARTVVEHLRFLLIPDEPRSGRADRRWRAHARQTDSDRSGLSGRKIWTASRASERHYSGWTLEAIRGDLGNAGGDTSEERYDRLAADALMLCDPELLGDDETRASLRGGRGAVGDHRSEFANQEQLRELLATIEERGRLIAY